MKLYETNEGDMILAAFNSDAPLPVGWNLMATAQPPHINGMAYIIRDKTEPTLPSGLTMLWACRELER